MKIHAKYYDVLGTYAQGEIDDDGKGGEFGFLPRLGDLPDRMSADAVGVLIEELQDVRAKLEELNGTEGQEPKAECPFKVGDMIEVVTPIVYGQIPVGEVFRVRAVSVDGAVCIEYDKNYLYLSHKSFKPYKPELKPAPIPNPFKVGDRVELITELKDSDKEKLPLGGVFLVNGVYPDGTIRTVIRDKERVVPHTHFKLHEPKPKRAEQKTPFGCGDTVQVTNENKDAVVTSSFIGRSTIQYDGIRRTISNEYLEFVRRRENEEFSFYGGQMVTAVRDYSDGGALFKIGDRFRVVSAHLDINGKVSLYIDTGTGTSSAISEKYFVPDRNAIQVGDTVRLSHRYKGDALTPGKEYMVGECKEFKSTDMVVLVNNGEDITVQARRVDPIGGNA